MFTLRNIDKIIDISDFTFKPTSHGRYLVTYTSPITNKSWSKSMTDMPLIDATHYADEPLKKDLNELRRLCKSK